MVPWLCHFLPRALFFPDLTFAWRAYPRSVNMACQLFMEVDKGWGEFGKEWEFEEDSGSNGKRTLRRTQW